MSDLKLGDIAEDGGRRSATSRLRGCLPALVAFALIAGLGIFVYVKGVALISNLISSPEDYDGNGHGSVVIEVHKGDTATNIAGTLRSADVVKSEQAFTEEASADPRSLTIQPGCYDLHEQMSGAEALSLILNDTSKVQCPGAGDVTIPEGYRADEVLARIADDTGLKPAAVQRAFHRTDALGLPAYARGDAEGYLFPATYPVSSRTTAPRLLRTMVAKFKAEAADLDLEGGAKRLGYSPHDVVVVASLVQGRGAPVAGHGEGRERDLQPPQDRHGLAARFDAALRGRQPGRDSGVGGSA